MVVQPQSLQTEIGMSLEDFIVAYDEAPFELIDGETITIVPGVAIHVITIRAIRRILESFVVQHQLGEVFVEAPFVLTEKSDRVKGSRVPDVMFYQAERFQQYTQQTKDWQRKPFILVPDLAIEVVSPNDRYTELNRKVNRYLSDGVSLVWVIDPQERNVAVYRPHEIALLNQNDTLTGGDILPGLEIEITSIMPDEVEAS